MEAIILAGGFGTRLQSKVQNIPKPIPVKVGNNPTIAIETLITKRPINIEPFLVYRSAIIPVGTSVTKIDSSIAVPISINSYASKWAFRTA